MPEYGNRHGQAPRIACRVSLDDFIEEFGNCLASRGPPLLEMDDGDTGVGLMRVHAFFAEALAETHGGGQQPGRSLVELRNLFQPGPTGRFERLECLLRAKQTYLTTFPSTARRDVLFLAVRLAARDSSAAILARAAAGCLLDGPA